MIALILLTLIPATALIGAALADHFLHWRFRRTFGRRRFGKSWFWGRSSAGT